VSEQDYQQRYAASLMNTFGPPKRVLVRGEGAHVWDADGREYVDLLGGIAVNALGHGHPALVEAVTRQLQTLGHISNFFASGPQVELAEKLLELVAPVVEVRAERALRDGRSATSSGTTSKPPPPRGKVFITNSGTEANEAAF
jgi:acetylornithine/N-succinyldiaminopimelate aminotransferase